jgi:hypothetical protein
VPAEGWAEYAEHEAATVRDQYATAPQNMQAALDVIAAAAPERRTYAEVEAALGWARGRLARVIGGWRSNHGSQYTRPYHICPPELSPRGEWEMWMDKEQAQALFG